MPKHAQKQLVSALFATALSIITLGCVAPPAARATSQSAPPAPVCASPEYHQFDFWLGDWEVQNPAGKIVGHNLVTSEQAGCLIVEHWKDTSGQHTGSSFNYFDTRDKKWHQLYISNSGNAGDFPAMTGEFRDSRMQLFTNPHDGAVSRWTWYVVTPGHVRQMAEQIQPDKSWQITWDSIYVKK